MKKLLFAIVLIASLVLNIYLFVELKNFRSAYHADFEFLEIRVKNYEKLLDRIYKDQEDYFLDVLTESEEYNEYVNLNENGYEEK